MERKKLQPWIKEVVWFNLKQHIEIHFLLTDDKTKLGDEDFAPTPVQIKDDASTQNPFVNRDGKDDGDDHQTDPGTHARMVFKGGKGKAKSKAGKHSKASEGHVKAVKAPTKAAKQDENRPGFKGENGGRGSLKDSLARGSKGGSVKDGKSSNSEREVQHLVNIPMYVFIISYYGYLRTCLPTVALMNLITLLRLPSVDIRCW